MCDKFYIIWNNLVLCQNFSKSLKLNQKRFFVRGLAIERADAIAQLAQTSASPYHSRVFFGMKFFGIVDSDPGKSNAGLFKLDRKPRNSIFFKLNHEVSPKLFGENRFIWSQNLLLFQSRSQKSESEVSKVKPRLKKNPKSPKIDEKSQNYFPGFWQRYSSYCSRTSF